MLHVFCYALYNHENSFHSHVQMAYTMQIVMQLLYINSGRRGGLVVSALDSGSTGPGSSPGRVIVLCSCARHFTLTEPLSTQEYKWVPANCPGNLTNCWEVTCDGLASHPSGGVAIFLVASWYRNRDKLRQSWATRLVRLTLPIYKLLV